MERKMIRFALAGSIVLITIALAAVGVFAACDYSAKCPMHNTYSTATGRQKSTDGGKTTWAEYQCPGLGSEAAHTFWVKCD